MIKAGIFDIGGVLHEDSTSYVFKDITDTLEISMSSHLKAWGKFIGDFTRGFITEDEFWKKFIKETGTNKTSSDKSLIVRSFIKNYNLNEEMVKLVKRIKNNGYKVAVLSNSIESHANYQHKIGIYKNFDFVVLSNEVGMKKPDTEIYKLVLKKLKLKPVEVFFVDDKEENINTAKNLGINSILFKDIHSFKIELKKLNIKF